MIRNSMFHKIAAVMIIALFACSSIFADTVFADVGSPKAGKISEMNIEFSYDPDSMQRLTFGFTEETDIDWFSGNGDLKNSGLNLKTQVMQGRGELARGKGEVNFYWILRTDKDVTAKLYLNGPLVEVQSADAIDWEIRFDSKTDNVVDGGHKIEGLYGQANAVPIFKRTSGNNQKVMIGYMPIEIYTDYAPVKIENQTYVGNVGVIVETD